MMVRNPYFRDIMPGVLLGHLRHTHHWWSNEDRAPWPALRIRWAARLSCKRLRGERNAAQLREKILIQQLEDANIKLDHLQGAIESAIADGRWSEWSRFGSRAEAVRHDLECALEESR